MTTLRNAESYDSIDSTEMRILHALSTTGSLTQVAATLGLSQPAISQRLKRLEQRLAVPLIERQGRGVRLTPAGQILADHGRTVVAEIDAALAAIDDLRGDRGGVLRMAGFPSASATVIPRLMRMLQEQAPQVTFQYREQEPPEAIQLLRDGEVDCALVFQYSESEPLPTLFEFTPLWREEMWLVVPEERSQGMERAALSAFRDDQWIAGCTRCRGHLTRATKRHGFEPEIVQETDNMPASIAMVAAGNSVSMVPGLALAAQPTLPAGARALRLEEPEYRTIGLINVDTANESPAVKLAKRLLGNIDGSTWNLLTERVGR
ncbi:LysR family transcriptional regulator [Leucobacter chinensis]|uniref:LysR family transcriptional regulator n=1 Tax=Leucobacter chinensis TaxID=2851010 RepID=UPI001C22D268|nr:LysR family transcriptional regulator [Leucobacter chinensis]